MRQYWMGGHTSEAVLDGGHTSEAVLDGGAHQ